MRLRVLTALLLALTAGSCVAPGTSQALSLAEARPTWLRAGESVEGRPLEYAVFGAGPDTTLLLATIHGSESAGTPLLLELAERLARAPAWLEGHRVVLLPVANPDGYARATRHNARGVDLNRNFPSGNYRPGRARGGEPLSEPESVALHDLILRYEPARVLSIHQPLAVIDWDGPGEELARVLSEHSTLPARRLGGRPGSLGSYVGKTLGLPIITLELLREDDRCTAAELWERYGPLLLAAVGAPSSSSRARFRSSPPA